MHRLGGLDPVHLARFDVPRNGFAAITKFNVQTISAQNHRDPMKRVSMPRRRFARRELLPAHEGCPATMQHLLLSSWIIAFRHGSKLRAATRNQICRRNRSLSRPSIAGPAPAPVNALCGNLL